MSLALPTRAQRARVGGRRQLRLHCTPCPGPGTLLPSLLAGPCPKAALAQSEITPRVKLPARKG